MKDFKLAIFYISASMLAFIAFQQIYFFSMYKNDFLTSIFSAFAALNLVLIVAIPLFTLMSFIFVIRTPRDFRPLILNVTSICLLLASTKF